MQTVTVKLVLATKQVAKLNCVVDSRNRIIAIESFSTKVMSRRKKAIERS